MDIEDIYCKRGSDENLKQTGCFLLSYGQELQSTENLIKPRQVRTATPTSYNLIQFSSTLPNE